MKVTVSDFIISFFDLLEAEIRAFKSGSEEFLDKEYKNFQNAIFKSLASVLGVAISGILFLIAVFMLTGGLFLFLNKFFSIMATCFILSIIFFIFGICLLWFIKKKNE